MEQEKIKLTVKNVDHHTTILINENGDTFAYNPQTKNGDELDDFIRSSVVPTPSSLVPTEEKPEYFIWDGINRDFEEVPNLDKAEKTIREWISQDGDIHPDSESVFVLQKVSVPVITETGEFTTNNEGEQVPICNISFNRVAPKEGWVKVEEMEQFINWAHVWGIFIFNPQGCYWINYKNQAMKITTKELYELFKTSK